MTGTPTDPTTARSAEDPDLAEFGATRDDAVRAVILDRYDWVAQHAARRFRNRGEPFDDLLQVARIGVLKALDRYEPDKGSGFPAYATATAVGEIRRHFRDTTWKVHVPRRAKELQSRVRDAIETLSNELSRTPTPIELARHLDIPEDVLLDALDAGAANRTASIDQPRRADAGRPLAATLTTDEPSVPELVEMSDLLGRLPERERRIVQMRFYDGLTQEEIARNIGISQMHVSRLLRSTLQALRLQIED